MCTRRIKYQINWTLMCMCLWRVWYIQIPMQLIMPPPLGAGSIMFSGCPSVRPSVQPSVCPSEALNTLFTPVHGSVGPSDQPWPFCDMSVRPSVRPSARRGFWAFAGERMKGMAWNFACWCILATFRNDKIMVTVCWFSSFWHHFNLVKKVKFGDSGHFPENAWR